uniref:SAHS1 n=1 Tax=Ramazzottius varieornatus TaxID=947166 RepID=UPI000B80301E|nr:Chain A, SAHS1 [Ramazzottius varieornatus]5XN9_B Chain B, SAHS1 [Ramazzottius varieornatus]5XNA_A Chain A, SAHS1 [Ramazzottius varieornatus]5XNA_B Chain B, SAHS1 [Ramazzottius varieornatus]
SEWTGKSWMGKWESTDRIENFDAFISALGLPLEQYGGNHKTFHKIWKEGDHYHHQISVPDKNYKNDVNFKLNEEGTTQHNNTEIKYKYTEDGGNLKAEVHVPSRNKVIHDEYKVNGDELEKTYKVGDVTAKRWYKKSS